MTWNLEILLKIFRGYKGNLTTPAAFMGSYSMSDLIAYIAASPAEHFSGPAEKGLVLQRLRDLATVVNTADIVMTQEDVQLPNREPFLTSLNEDTSLANVAQCQSHTLNWPISKALYGVGSHLANSLYVKNRGAITAPRSFPLFTVPDHIGTVTPRCAIIYRLSGEQSAIGEIAFYHGDGGRYQDLGGFANWDSKFKQVYDLILKNPEISVLVGDNNSKLIEESSYLRGPIAYFGGEIFPMPDAYFQQVLIDSIIMDTVRKGDGTGFEVPDIEAHIRAMRSNPDTFRTFCETLKELAKDMNYQVKWLAWLYGLDWFLFKLGFVPAERGFSSEGRPLHTSSFGGTVDNFYYRPDRLSIHAATIEAAPSGGDLLFKLGDPSPSALSDHRPICATISSVVKAPPALTQIHELKFGEYQGRALDFSSKDMQDTMIADMLQYFHVVQASIASRMDDKVAEFLADLTKTTSSFGSVRGP